MYRNQIDFILIRNIFKNAVKQVKTYPGADIGSDHVPVTCKLQIKIKKPRKSALKEQRDLPKLREEQTRISYNLKIKNYYDALENDEMEQQPEEIIEEEWKHLKESIIAATEECHPKKQKTKKKRVDDRRHSKKDGGTEKMEKRWRKI